MGKGGPQGGVSFGQGGKKKFGGDFFFDFGLWKVKNFPFILDLGKKKSTKTIFFFENPPLQRGGGGGGTWGKKKKTVFFFWDNFILGGGGFWEQKIKFLKNFFSKEEKVFLKTLFCLFFIPLNFLKNAESLKKVGWLFLF